MPFWNRFGKRWAATGVVAEPTDNQADAGFAYLGANPPTVEQFNGILRNLDDKDNWLYTRITEVLIAGGVTPTETTQDQLLIAMRTLFQPNMAVYTESTAFIVPASVMRVKVRLWGGGGGGGGSFGPNGAGSGGGAGGYCEGIFSVNPSNSIFVTVGLGGTGSRTNEIYSAGFGGLSSFGTFCTAFGGNAGSGGLNNPANTSGAGGGASGGILNLNGLGGGFGQPFGNGSWGGGLGGGSPFGGGISPLTIAGSGNPGNFPGGGATGAGQVPNAPSNFSYNGGQGANGLAIIEW